MERHRLLDSVGRTPTKIRAATSLTFLLAIAVSAVGAIAQTSYSQAPAPSIQQLFDQQRWNDVIEAGREASLADANTDYYYGSALARVGRWPEARAAFLAGERRWPRDSRFPIELAGVAFKQKRYAEATRWLRRGLALSPHDAYANDFLATIYFMQGNLDAALKYWNRANKPRIVNLRVPPNLRVDPQLLDHAFAFAPASLFRLPDLQTTDARIGELGIFPTYSIRLDAHDDGTFDAEFRAQERDGWGGNKWAALLSPFRGIFYDTIYPEYTNIGGSATNASGLIRWDSQKRRLLGSLSGPVERNPKYRYSLAFDLRDEHWRLRPLSRHGVPTNGSLTLGREALNAEFISINSGTWNWSASGELSHRSYASVVEGSQLPAAVLLSGWQLKQITVLTRTVWRAPEHRFDSTASVSAETGAIWSAPAHAFEKLQASLLANWEPRLTGDDYATHLQFRAGKTYGSVPFDELFMLGLERDNDLPMRAHIGTLDGDKGSAPLGRDYVLVNSDIDKNVYGNGLLVVKLSPFLDTGKITDPLAGLGSRQWLYDVGLQIKLRLLGVGITFSYGKDLRTGNNTFYFSALQ